MHNTTARDATNETLAASEAMAEGCISMGLPFWLPFSPPFVGVHKCELAPIKFNGRVTIDENCATSFALVFANYTTLRSDLRTHSSFHGLGEHHVAVVMGYAPCVAHKNWS